MKIAVFEVKPAEALEKIEAKVERLIQDLKHESSGVRSGAARALGKIGDARAVEPLIQALKDEDSGVRWGAAMALGDIGDARAMEPLLKAFLDKDEDGSVRAAAGVSLKRIKEKGSKK